MTRRSRRTAPPPTGPGAGTRRSVLLIVVAAAMIAFGRIIGPGPDGSVVLLLLVLALVVAGILVAIGGVRFGIRAVRAGRDVASAPLVIGAFLAVWGVVVLAGTIGRFLGWR
jgi:hypothetical protein